MLLLAEHFVTVQQITQETCITQEKKQIQNILFLEIMLRQIQVSAAIPVALLLREWYQVITFVFVSDLDDTALLDNFTRQMVIGKPCSRPLLKSERESHIIERHTALKKVTLPSIFMPLHMSYI